MEITEKSFVLTFDELRILLYSQGCSKCEGVYMPPKEFSQLDILSALNSLTKGGLLTVGAAEPQREALPLIFEDEAKDDTSEKTSADRTEDQGGDNELFFIRSDLLKIIRIIADHNASDVVQAEPGSGRRLFIYYSEEGIVTSERYPGRKETVRLTYHDADEFNKYDNEAEGRIIK